jgi:GTPase Era involved in 16S rRNA processing
MSLPQFQDAHANLHALGNQLGKFVQDMQSQAPVTTADTDTLAVIAADIEQALQALEKQHYRVAVIAAMKAGKSTFLNALIGADVLASETESCTVCRTEVKPISTRERPCLVEYREGQTQPFLIAQGESQKIRQRFLQRTHQIRATDNRDRVHLFALYHPIAALQKYPFLKGFTLVDTPGPNEWQDSRLDVIRLKETTLEVLRNCEVVIFILDYSSFKDQTNSELLRELTQERGDFLRQNRGAIYFILNKIDRKTEEDRPIAQVIEDIRLSLQEFGIMNPIVYPASAWQGLLSKLIQQGTATENHLKNFKRFFSAAYARETHDGDLITPSPRKVAAQSLQDSLIPQIEQSILHEIMQNAGWNLLHDVAIKLGKAADALDDIVTTRIQGWHIEIEPLRERMAAYKQLAGSAIVKIREVKTLVTAQEHQLIAQFKQEIITFADRAKQTIQQALDSFILDRTLEAEAETNVADLDAEIPSPWDSGTPPPPPRLAPQAAATMLPIPSQLTTLLHEMVELTLEDPDNPYALICRDESEVEQIKRSINQFCSTLIRDWWTNTHDQLSQKGTHIRQELATEIQHHIQQISNEISQYLGEALEVSLHVNPIQILGFDFSGIDTQVQQQTENYTRWTRERKKALCRDYEVDIQVEDHRSYYEIDLYQTIEAIKYELDSQAKGSLMIVERVIKRQIATDFGLAEKQINDYIQRFLVEFDRLVKERETREAEVEKILSLLTEQKLSLELYRQQLHQVNQGLYQWQPRIQ